MSDQKFTLLRKILKALGLPDERVDELIAWIQGWLLDEKEEKSGQVRFPYRLKDEFLSNAELSFYHVLQQAAGDWATVVPQVGLINLFYAQTGDYGENRRYTNRIDRKRLDFLLCDPQTMQPLLGVELDDRSHRRTDRRQRDRFVDGVFHAAGLPLVHVPAQYHYDVEELRALLRGHAEGTATGTSAASQNGERQKPPFCPQCGTPMVLRTARRGQNAGSQFWGCANYPQCKTTIPLS